MHLYSITRLSFRFFKTPVRRFSTEQLSPITTLNINDLQEITRRLKSLHRLSIRDKPRAAVLLPLCLDVNEQPSVLFTLRSQKVGSHKV